MDNATITVFSGCLVFGSISFYWNTRTTRTYWLKMLTVWWGILGFISSGIILGMEVFKVLGIR